MGQRRDLGGALPERADDGDALGRFDRRGRERQAERNHVAGRGIAAGLEIFEMAVRMAGMRFDAGDWAEFLSANIYFALQDESLRYELLGLLKNFVQFK